MHACVFVGTRHTSALCYLCVCSPCPPPWLFVCSNQCDQDVARHGNILAFLVAVCGLGMQVRIRTNSLEFEFAPNSHEFVYHSELEFATSNSNPP